MQFSATEKVIFGVLVLVALITSLAMAARAAESFMTEVPAYGGTLREGVIGLPRTINPVLAVTDVDKDITSLVYAGLMRYDDGKLVTDVASSYEVSDDGLTYTFKIRPDARFQDGRSLTASDVAFTIQKIQDPILKSPRRADWANVTVTEVSPGEIQFTLKQPYAPFLTNTTVGIIPKHIWGAVSDEQFIFSQYNIEPIGAGAYKITGIRRDAGGIPTLYKLSSWGRYHGEAPYIKTIAFFFFSDEDKAISALDNGAIDSLGTVSSLPASRLAASTATRYVVESTPLPRVFGVFFNQNQNAVLADKAVRQALDMAVDREALVDTVLSGYGEPITGPLAAGMTGATKTSPKKDEAKTTTSSSTSTPADSTSMEDDFSFILDAQALLEKNGWKINSEGVYEKKSGSTVKTLAFSLYTADTSDLKQAAEMVKDTWENMGAKVDLKIFEPGDLYQNIIRTRKYDALLFGEQIGKDRDLYAFWHSSQRNAPGLNIAQYTNSKTDKLLEDIRATRDEDARADKYAQFEQTVKADIPAVFLYSPDFIYVVPKTLGNLKLDGITSPSDRWNSVTKWFVNTENVWKVFARD